MIYFFAAFLLCFLLLAKYKQLLWLEWLTKPSLSLLFILVAVMQAGVDDWFSRLMVVGFVFCFLGDVFLISTKHKMFLCGLVVFLTGHILYVAAFFHYAVMEQSIWLAAVLLLVIGITVYIWLADYIKTMLLPILTYMTVISVMVLLAYGVFVNEGLRDQGRLLLFLGAISFYLSDLFVVRQQFVVKSFINPLLGLPLYYAGQFALAASLAYLSPIWA